MMVSDSQQDGRLVRCLYAAGSVPEAGLSYRSEIERKLQPTRPDGRLSSLVGGAHCMTGRWLGERCCLGWLAFSMSLLIMATFRDKCMTVPVLLTGSAEVADAAGTGTIPPWCGLGLVCRVEGCVIGSALPGTPV